MRRAIYSPARRYDIAGTPDICEAFGAIRCLADCEGSPDFSLTVASREGFATVGVHSCVQATEPSPRAGTVVQLAHKLRFSPPAHEFELCRYTVQAGAVGLPVRGFFQLKTIGGGAVQMLLQLKVDDKLPTSFEACEARIPLHGRGRVDDVEANPGNGSVVVEDNGPDGGTLVWKLNIKRRGMELSLPATVRFGGGGAADAVIAAEAASLVSHSDVSDPFCAGANACVQIIFALNDYSVGGCTIDPGTVTSSSSAKVKVQVARRVLAGEYLIWNSLGRSRRCVPPGEELPAATI